MLGQLAARLIAVVLLLLIGQIVFSTNSWARCITARGGEGREGPGATYEKVWETLEHMPLQVLGYKKGWIRVRNSYGYVFYVHPNRASKKFRCVTLKRKSFLWNGPSTTLYRKAIQEPFEKFTSFRRVRKHPKKSGWAQIKDALGGLFWIKLQ